MIEQSESIAKLSEAFSRVQGKIEGAKKTGLNPHFKSKFADLSEVYSVCRQALSDEKVAVFQFPSAEGKVVRMTTMVAHAGEWIRGTVQCEARNSGPQDIGGAITYLRRYGLCSVIGIEQVDDDGNSAQDRTPIVASELNRQGKPLSLIPKVIEAMQGKSQKDLPAVVRGM
jgi:hypothetical protein